jgi:hypothetical protein
MSSLALFLYIYALMTLCLLHCYTLSYYLFISHVLTFMWHKHNCSVCSSYRIVCVGVDLPLMAMNGRVCIVGSRGPVEINPRDLMSKELEVILLLLIIIILTIIVIM